MRVGHFPTVGQLEELSCPSDTVLLWTGATSHVDLAYRDIEGKTHQERFERGSGAIDIMPRGMTIEQVRWRNDGGGSSCVSVNFPSRTLSQLLGDRRDLVETARPRFALSDPHAADLITRLQAQVVCGNPLGAAYAQGLSLTLASYLFGSHARA